MSSWLTTDWLPHHGPTVLLGSTLVLGAGWLAMRLHRSLVDRHRLGVWTALATLLFLLAAVSPMPRWSWPEATPTNTPATASAAVSSPRPAPSTAMAPTEADPAARILLLQAQLDHLLAEDARAPATTTPAPPPTTVSVGALLAFVYLLGAALVLLRAGLGLLRLFVLLRGSRPAPRHLLAGLHLPRRARIRVLPGDVRPFCCAFVRPLIVVPAALLTPGHEQQLAAVLQHEAAHLRHRDPLVQLLLALLTVPLWPHPLLWLLARDLRFLGELRADDAAAAQAPTAYARALLTLADGDLRTPRVAGTVAVFHKPSDFFRRIQMLLQREGRLHSRSSRAGKLAQAGVMLALTLGAAGVFGVPATAQDPQGRTLRKENARLQDEIATLRAELDSLRAMLDKVRADRVPAESPDAVERDVVDRAKQRWQRENDRATAELKASMPAPGVSTFGGFPQANVHEASRQDIERMVRDLQRATAAEKAADNDQEVARLNRMLHEALQRRSDAAPGSAEPFGSPVTGAGFGSKAAPVAEVPAHSIETYRGIPAGTISRDQPQPATDPAPDSQPPTQEPAASVPVLRDVPILNRMFTAGADGLPSQAVDVAMVPQSALTPQPAASTSTVDAIADLTSRCIDLRTEVEIQEADLAEMSARAEKGFATNGELRRAKIRLDSQQRKLAIVMRLLDGEIAATESEVARYEHDLGALKDTGDKLRAQVQLQRAMARLDALRAVK
ncbi:MAG: M48 family metalloprotease [Planctomycetes bacterium]|nr:M48 family metalloprotease [Planctomycetota bacterium]